MITTIELENKVRTYKDNCTKHNHEPTYNGLSNVLGVSHQTIANVVHGTYNGKQYTDKPHITRCIDNNDFELIKELYI